MRVRSLSARRLTVVFTLLFLAVAVESASAQGIFGNISGTLKDPSGAVVPGATVTIINEETKIARPITTDENGFYIVASLPSGRYTVTAEQKGFKVTTKSGNVLVAGARLTVDIALEIGATSETVSVTAMGETVNTTSGEISRIIDSQQVQSLALNQRNYEQLVTMVPGAALVAFDQTAWTTGMSITAASINGMRTDGNLFTVDGGLNIDSGSFGSQLTNVGIDFTREVAVQTSNFAAEYGRSQGAVVNVVTKSGGDSFHGGVFEFLRNNIFDATNAASKWNAAPGTPSNVLKPALRYNDFGWDFGGPIMRGKLFFFAGEEWKRIRLSQSPQGMTIPTTAELSGNFADQTQLLTAKGTVPASCIGNYSGTTFVPSTTSTGYAINPSCITADGKAIANVYSAMAKAASAFSNTPSANNATFQPYNPQNWREDIIRADYRPTNKHSLYYRYLHDQIQLVDSFGTFYPGGLPTTPTLRKRPGWSHQISHVWTISPRLVNEAKFTAAWQAQRIPPFGNTWQRSNYGFQFPLPFPGAGLHPDGIPHVTFTGIGSAYPTAAPAQFTGPYFTLVAPVVDKAPSDNLTWQVRSHTLKFGVYFARNGKDQNPTPDSYNGAITFQVAGNPNSTGNPFADALLGNFQGFTQYSDSPVAHFRYNYFAAYAQDSWKVTGKFSLEFGIRYERSVPTYTQANNMVNFDPSLYDPSKAPTAVSSSNVPTSSYLDLGYVINGLVRPGDVPQDQLGRFPTGNSPFVTAVPATAPRGFYQPQNLWSPRFGFAYSPFGKGTVIRAGFGVFYDKPEGNIVFGQVGNVPILKAVTYNNGNLSSPTGSVGASTPTIFGIGAVAPDLVVASTLQYSLSVQRELPGGFFLETAYVGNLGRHQLRRPNINVPSFATALANAGKTTNQMRPYLGYTDIQQYRSDSNSNYNALQVSASKRKGIVMVTFSYTYSKVLGQASAIGDNLEPECPFSCTTTTGQAISWRSFYYGPLTFDRRNNFIATYTLSSPFFRNLKGIGGAVLSGWELSGITRAQSGQALTVLGNQTIGPSGSGVASYARRANLIVGTPLYSGYTCPSGKVCWFNPAAFTAASNSGVGTAPVGVLFGPGYYAWDFSLRKVCKLSRIREGMNLMFQADAFNAFNWVNYGNPGTSVTSGGFGQVSSTNPPRNVQFGLKITF